MQLGYDDATVSVPRSIRFPVELTPPPGFDPDDLSTWPKVDGRLEYVDGRLLYMSPCGEDQADVVLSVAGVLRDWLRQHRDFRGGSNEAGMKLGKDARGADAAVWRRTPGAQRSKGFRRYPPVLAVEVAGENDDEAKLREKAQWYLDREVAVVWIVIPETLEVVVLTAQGEVHYDLEATLDEHPDLPGLAPKVRELFEQLVEED